MEYQINPSAYSSMFAVPCAIVDKHIKLAGSAQLKVLLWFLRYNNTGLTIEDASAAIGLPQSDIKDAFLYWEEAGIVITAGKEKPVEAPAEKPVKQIKPVHTAKPSREDTIKRGCESQEIAFLMKEVQMKLGRLISQNEASTLVWLHDNEGLPVPVILMSVQYAISQDKANFRYIEKICVDWAANDINTLERAEQRINELYLANTTWHIVQSAFGIDSRKASDNELKYCLKWINQYGFNKEMLSFAYNECVDNIRKLSFPYIDKILDKWYKNGIKTVKQAEEFKGTGKSEKNKKSTSYDIDNIMKKAESFFDEE